MICPRCQGPIATENHSLQDAALVEIGCGEWGIVCGGCITATENDQLNAEGFLSRGERQARVDRGDL